MLEKKTNLNYSNGFQTDIFALIEVSSTSVSGR